MPATVLVAYDGSSLSERALVHAIETFPDAAIMVLYVINPMDAVVDVEAGGLPVAEGWYEAAEAEAASRHAAATDLAADRGVDVETVTELGRPARTVLEYATEHDVDHVVMGSHGRSGLDRALLGSVAETVTRRAAIPVTVVS